MSQPIWQMLMRVISLDQKAREINQKIEECYKQISFKEDHKEILKQNIQEHETELSNSKKEVRNLENEMNAVFAQVDEKRKTLDNLRNPKELRALEKELKITESKHQEIEDKLLGVWHKLEASEKKLIQEKAVYHDNLASVDEEINSIKEEIKNLSIKHQECIVEHDQALAQVPSEWRGRYEHMKGKVVDPIVPMLNDYCSACFYLVLPSDCARIKKGAILPCHNCYRFLYYSKDEEKKEEKASY